MKHYDKRIDDTKHPVCECGHWAVYHNYEVTKDVEEVFNECRICQCPKFKHESDMTYDEFNEMKRKAREQETTKVLSNIPNRVVENDKPEKDEIKKDPNLKSDEWKLLEAYTRDVGRGIARLDYDTMDELNCSTGDVIEVTSNKTAVFKVLPLYPTDEDKKLIRIDGLGRENLDTVIGGIVKIKKVKAVHCDNYVVAPLEDIPPIDERYLSDALESLPVKTGHNVLIPYFGGRLKFVIKATTPEGAVIITQKSKCIILDKKPSEYDEVEQALIDQKSELVDKLKRAVKDKNAKDIIKLTNEIADLDLLNSTIKNVLSGRQLKVKPLYHGIIRDALEEALRSYANKHKEEKKEK